MSGKGTQAPRVTVLLPVHQGRAFLGEAIDSILAQSFRDFELLVVDDGSTDGSARILESYDDPRLRVVRNDRNLGVVRSLNRGLELARGEIVARMDADDVSLPERLRRQIAFLDAHPEVGACGAWAVGMGALPGVLRKLPTAPEDVRCQLLFSCALVHPTVCLRREAFLERDLRFEEAYPHSEDYALWVRASEHFPLANLPEVLLRHRAHEGSVSRRFAGVQRATVARIHREALEKLGIHASEEELRLHAGLGGDDLGEPAIERLEAWLLALLGANRECGRYPAQAFERAVGRRWQRLVRRAAWQGRPLGRLLSSPLAETLPVADRLRLRARSVQRALRSAPRETGGGAPRVILLDALGGVTSYVLDLTSLPAFRERRARRVWIEGTASDQSPAKAERPGDARIRHRWPGENLFVVLRRMRRVLGRERGPLIANELFGLAYAARHGGDAPVVQILHGDIPMYYELAERFAPWVDAFVAVSARVAEEARRRLPHRAGDVHHLVSAVPPPARTRLPVPGPLRLVYAGRLDAKKGVLDLPQIDRLLRARGVAVHWTVMGAGPDEAELLDRFDADASVDLTGALSPAACRARMPDHDVLVLPSYGEGLPLSLLEAMAAGVVPVVSDLESGIREVVEDGATGLPATPGRPEEFAAAIARLAQDRESLERMSKAAAEHVGTHHSLEALGAAFLELLDTLERRPGRSRPPFTRGPSRLDRPWLPNVAVRSIRAALSRKR